MERGEESAQKSYGRLRGKIAEVEAIIQDEYEHENVLIDGSITGIVAALSMGASEYLSTKTEGGSKDPIKASVYTGSAYIATVLVLVLPYLMLENYYVALACTLATAVVIITFFNYYIAVAKDVSFKKRFLK